MSQISSQFVCLFFLFGNLVGLMVAKTANIK